MSDKLQELEKRYWKMNKRLSDLRRENPGEKVNNYSFLTSSGEVLLSNLFGSRNELILIHSMGKSCPYCTLWADGFNGLVSHLENAASFVIVSPDAPDVQASFAESRNWRFRMVTYGSNAFAKDMGFEPEREKFKPGVSGFLKSEDGSMTRKGHATFGPGDQFCAQWPFLDLIGKSSEDWTPKPDYES